MIMDEREPDAAHKQAIKDMLEEDDFIWNESFLEDDIVFRELDKIKEDSNEVD